MELPKAIISDADGTLVNTLHLIRHGQYEATKKFLQSHKIPLQEIPDFDTFQAIQAQTIGGSAHHTLENTVRKIYEASPHRTNDMDFDALHNLLNPIQDAIAPDFVKPYHGLSRLLHRLGEESIRFGIFSSGTPHHIVRNFGVALPELGMTELFKDTSETDTAKLSRFVAAVLEFYQLPDFTVVTCDDSTTHKPNPESLNLAMTRLGVTPQKSLVFGDHTVDMQAAVNAGVTQRVGVTHGFSTKQELLTAGATDTVDSLDEFIAKL